MFFGVYIVGSPTVLTGHSHSDSNAHATSFDIALIVKACKLCIYSLQFDRICINSPSL